MLGGGTALSDDIYNIDRYAPRGDKIIGGDGKVYSLSELLQSAGEKTIEPGSVSTDAITDGAITIPKLAQEVITRIDEYKFTPLSGSNNDANNLMDTGIYFNVGGYGLHNAPRNNYGWMLIVSHGVSNGHPRGAQVYFDHDGFDWRGFNGDTLTDWQTCIVKKKVDDVEAIADPSTATTADIADAYNVLLSALKG